MATPVVDEILARVEELETRLEKLRGLYDQYFQGIERTEPGQQRSDFEKRMADLRKQGMKSTVTRFKYQQLVQRHTTYANYWQRICRQIEEGTFARDVRRARRNADKLAKVVGQRGPADDVHDLSDADFDAVDDFDPSALAGLEEVNTNAVDTERPAPMPAAQQPAPVPVPRAAPTGFALPTAAPLVAPRAAAPAPAPAQPVAAKPGPAPFALPPVHRPVVKPAATPHSLGGPALGGPAPAQPRALASTPPPAMAPARPAPAQPAPPAQPKPGPAPFALPPVHTARVNPAVPVRAPQPGGLPATGNTGRVPTVTAPQPAPARTAPAASAASGGDDPHLRQLYQQYRETRMRNGEGDVAFDTLARQVRDTLPKLAQKYPGADVSLDVTVKDGKTVLRPVVKTKR